MPAAVLVEGPAMACLALELRVLGNRLVGRVLLVAAAPKDMHGGPFRWSRCVGVEGPHLNHAPSLCSPTAPVPCPSSPGLTSRTRLSCCMHSDQQTLAEPHR